MQRILQRILQEIMKKKNTWNIRHLVDESFVPATQRIILKIVGFLLFNLVWIPIFEQNLEVWTTVDHGAWSEWWDHLSRPSLHYWRRQTAKLD